MTKRPQSQLATLVVRYSRDLAHAKDTSRFLHHYALMLENGLPPIEILDSLRRQQPDPRFALVIEDLIQKVFTGHSLAHAMSQHPRCFPSSVVLVVRAGEESGDIAGDVP